MPVWIKNILLCVLAGSLLWGCSEASYKIVGAWDLKSGSSTMKLTFQPDGTFTAESNDTSGTTSVIGDYHREGNTVFMTGQRQLALTVRLDSDNQGFARDDSGKELTLIRRK